MLMLYEHLELNMYLILPSVLICYSHFANEETEAERINKWPGVTFLARD